MIARIWDRMKFLLERFILGGAGNRLLLIAVLLALLTLAGGTLIYLHDRSSPQVGIESYRDALWWAVQRVSDTGPMGGDEGAFVRVVSAMLTILGVVLFLGGLVAIMTQWLNFTIGRLQGGYTPLALNNHILLLGWSSRTIAIVNELLLSEGRVRRFLGRVGAGKLQIVILAEEVVPAMIRELRERLGQRWNPKQVILRTGSPLRLDQLRRADFLHAAAIILPSWESATGDVEYPDARSVKTILATSRASRESGATRMPLMVAELGDAKKLDIAREAYGGPIEVLASDLIAGRLIAQSVRHPGVSFVYSELLRHDVGSEVYLRRFPQLAGVNAGALAQLFPMAVPIGLLRGEQTECGAIMNPDPGTLLEKDDRLVLLARGFDDAAPDLRRLADLTPVPIVATQTPRGERRRRRVLVLGWNHEVPAFIRELDSYDTEIFEVDMLSTVPQAERSAELTRSGAKATRTIVRLIEGDYTAPADIAALDAASYDNVVILSTDRIESEGERDARSILGALVLRRALRGAADPPHILVELLDAENVPLIQDNGDETILTPAVMSHILTQVALHRDLRVVYDELFGPGGAEVLCRSAAAYGVCGEPVGFSDIQRAATARGEIALGVRTLAQPGPVPGGLWLNPDRAKRWTLGPADEIVILAS